MTYNTLTDQEKERIFAADVLGWELKQVLEDKRYEAWHVNGEPQYTKGYFLPLTDLNHAMMGVEKLMDGEWLIDFHRKLNNVWYMYIYQLHPRIEYVGANVNFNEAIVEACIRIKRPDLFTED